MGIGLEEAAQFLSPAITIMALKTVELFTQDTYDKTKRETSALWRRVRGSGRHRQDDAPDSSTSPGLADMSVGQLTAIKRSVRDAGIASGVSEKLAEEISKRLVAEMLKADDR